MKIYKQFILFFVLLFSCSINTNQTSNSYALAGAKVALYNDFTSTSGAGSWVEGVTAIKNALTTMGISYEEVSNYDLNYSTQNFSTLYNVILIPGGYSYYYNYWISSYGKKRIRDFVNGGGGYIGICAGSFFASDISVWEGVSYDDKSYLNYLGEYSAFELDLFPGQAVGPINEIADWNGAHWNMETFNFYDSQALAGYKTAPFTEDIIYIGGPYFSGFDPNFVEVIASYSYNGQAAIVSTSFGYGKVVLFGPHPEIEEDSDRDGVTLNTSGRPTEAELNDNGSDWDLFEYAINYVASPKQTLSGKVFHSFSPPADSTIDRGGKSGAFYSTTTNNSSSEISVNVYRFITDASLNATSYLGAGFVTFGAKESISLSGSLLCPLTATPGWNYHLVEGYDSSTGELLFRDSFPIYINSGQTSASGRPFNKEWKLNMDQ